MAASPTGVRGKGVSTGGRLRIDGCCTTSCGKEVHGPLLAGTEIKDGDRENVAIDNLRCRARTVASRARGARNQFTKKRVTAGLMQYESLVRSIGVKRFGWLPADGVPDPD